MEIKVFLSHDLLQANKSVFCARVDDLTRFSYEGAYSFLKSVYGSGCIIMFVCV